MIPIESKILKELKKGDHSAFEKIFERYSGKNGEIDHLISV